MSSVLPPSLLTYNLMLGVRVPPRRWRVAAEDRRYPYMSCRHTPMKMPPLNGKRSRIIQSDIFYVNYNTQYLTDSVGEVDPACALCEQIKHTITQAPRQYYLPTPLFTL